MGTKANPGPYDCYAKAADDEPIFTLRANDPVAEFFVAAWVAIYAGDVGGAVKMMVDASEQHKEQGKLLDRLSPKSVEAQQVSMAMRTWRIGQYIESIERKKAANAAP